MKKINSYHLFGSAVSGIILTILLLMSMRTTAQTVNSIPLKDIRSEYIQIVGTTVLMSAKLTIEIDFGQMSNIWRAKDNVILDENGKSMKFNSMIDALNFFAKYGYEFVTAYTVTLGNTNVYHYLLRKKSTE